MKSPEGKPLSRAVPGVTPPGAERAKAALLKLKGDHPSPRSCECDFCATHSGLEALEGLQLHGS